MSDQDIFDILADTEEKLFYAWCNNIGNTNLQKAHESVKAALKSFAMATGCCNSNKSN